MQLTSAIICGVFLSAVSVSASATTSLRGAAAAVTGDYDDDNNNDHGRRDQEVCSYCQDADGCFKDTARVDFSQGSSATCAQIKELAPKLTASQCEIEREFIEDACCCDRQQPAPTPPPTPATTTSNNNNNNSDTQGRVDPTTVPAPPTAAPIGPRTGDDRPCAFCTGRYFVEENIVTFSNGSDMVTCSGLLSLIDSPNFADFCSSESVAIERDCCSNTQPPTMTPTQAPIAAPQTASPSLPVQSQWIVQNSDGTRTVLTTEEFSNQFPTLYASIVGSDQPETAPTATPMVQDALLIDEGVMLADLEGLDSSNTTNVNETTIIAAEDTNTTNATTIVEEPIEEPPATSRPRPSTVKGGGKREIKPIGTVTHVRETDRLSSVVEGRTETSANTKPATLAAGGIRDRQRVSVFSDTFGGAASF